jgi:hypothetical protein
MYLAMLTVFPFAGLSARMHGIGSIASKFTPAAEFDPGKRYQPIYRFLVAIFHLHYTVWLVFYGEVVAAKLAN